MPTEDELRAENARLRTQIESLKSARTGRTRVTSSPRIPAARAPSRETTSGTGPPHQAPTSGSGQPLLMVQALGLEVAAIKKKGGSTSVDLAGGVFVAMSNDSFLYRFVQPRPDAALFHLPTVF